MPFAKLSSVNTLFYLDENPAGKPAIFLLHGLGANSNSWQMQIPDLVQAGFRVIAPDSPGFGQLTNPGAKTSPHFLANLYSGLVDHLGLKSIIATGISMGGTHALQMAIDYPARIEKLVLVNTFSKLRITNPIVLPYFLLRMILVHTLGLETQAKSVAKRIFPRPEQEMLRQEYMNQVQQADPRTYRSAMRSLSRFNVTKRLNEIRCPTLVISGERDTTVPLPTQKKLAQSIPNAKHIIIPDAGHAVTIDQYLTFNQTLLNFLKNTSLVTNAGNRMDMPQNQIYQSQPDAVEKPRMEV